MKSAKKLKTVPFDLKLWEKNKNVRVQTRDGKHTGVIVEYIPGAHLCLDVKFDDEEKTVRYNEKGWYWSNEPCDIDILIVDEEAKSRANTFESYLAEIVEYYDDSLTPTQFAEAYAPGLLEFAEKRLRNKIFSEGYEKGYDSGKKDANALLEEGFERMKRWKFEEGFKHGLSVGESRAKTEIPAHPEWISVYDTLPAIDEEVIALTNVMNGKELPTASCICYAHRPNPNGWDGKDILTGKVTHHDVQMYDGWNIPGVQWWIPCPKLPEEE